ncbi:MULTISPECIES: tyrosine-protein phosphatase [Pseudidiomarina]|uniref:Uncharacterized protein (TIGR01244 family) n=2 Tax=Pseudidiomarina TaxID=2800384 RepID=A0A368UXU3_9GAMM|nr:MULTISPECIES: sulfur transferase domain-containing protein [Pseudidiomarina]PWW14120.1 uncharacterized protein (TIGR01244 family) [Pseudidiomarina maritima]RBP91934.1 uncharacterized protein (TIGR01244 family) [Pseudidiomarina tainanensis]RCW33698.1 uncharacterized protein (TIGR01244 family) [Pseudidiomarina tainanensis]
MKIITLLAAAAIFTSVLSACAPTPATPAPTPLADVLQPSPDRYVSGQPTKQQLAALQQLGVRQVINLRSDAEVADHPEPEWVAALQLNYQHLPIRGAADLTLANIQAFDQLLATPQPTLLHCSSGNRVGAMMALRAYWLQQASAEQALRIGYEHGLGDLEDSVKQLLQD